MAAPQSYRTRTLVLVGGFSSRMGSPKHLLPIPISPNDSQPLLIHLLKVLWQFSSVNDLGDVVTFSVRDQNQRKEIENLLHQHHVTTDTSVEFVMDSATNAGPTQGLLAAHSCDKTAHWLVMACDYPLLTTNTLLQLIQAHHTSKSAVTCFQNDEGFAEPLLAIWTPSALSILADLSDQADFAIGPNQAIKKLEIAAANESLNGNQQHRMGVKRIQPLDSSAIRGVNTRNEWEAVQKQLRI